MPAARNFDRVISADSHVIEPVDLWWNALGGKLGDRTPRIINEYNGQQGTFFYSGNQGRPVARIRAGTESSAGVCINIGRLA